jgi:hypothetical protein
MFSANLQRSVIVIASFAVFAFLQAATNPADLITNGGFDDGLTGWDWVPSHNVAKANGTAVNGQLVCEVINTGVFWEIQLRQLNLPIEKGVTYVLMFDAKSEPERTMIFGVERNDGHLSYDPNAGGQNPVKLTGTMQTFKSTFTMVEATDNKARLSFSFGEMISTITFDNISLIDSTKITAVRPQRANLIETGYSQKIAADQRGISFRFADVSHCGFQIYSLSGKVIVGSGSLNQGSASQYRVDYRSLGIASGKYVAQALDGDQRYSRIFAVMP